MIYRTINNSKRPNKNRQIFTQKQIKIKFMQNYNKL